jgi:hypothetical protein
LDHPGLSTIQYIDFLLPSSGVAATVTSLNILSPFLSPGGIFPTYPQIARPVLQNNTVTFTARLHLISFDVYWRVTGSQANAIASGDLYNTIRTVLVEVGPTYSETPIVPLNGLDNFLYLVDTTRVMCDKTHLLSSTAFDSLSGYNVPAQDIFKCTYRVNRVVECFGTPGNAWDTRKYSYRLYYQGDSAVPPSPTIIASIRMHYKVLLA